MLYVVCVCSDGNEMPSFIYLAEEHKRQTVHTIDKYVFGFETSLCEDVALASLSRWAIILECT